MAGSLTITPRTSFALDDLIPKDELLPALEHGLGAWRSTGLRPSMTIAGPFQPGWWRVHTRITRLDDQKVDRVQAEFHADFGDGFETGSPLERVLWYAGLDENQIFFQLQRPAQAISFQPLNGPALFQLQEFSAVRLSKVRALFAAITRKRRLLREYNCTGNVLRKGIKLFFSGRWGEIRRKLFKALPDTRRYHPETDAYLRSISGLGRWRAPLSHANRERLLTEYGKLSERPPIAVVFPVHGISGHQMTRAVESVISQVYREWELHLVLPNDAAPTLIKLADNFAQRQEGIRVTVADAASTLDEALADCLDRVEAERLVFLHPGFELVEEALLRLAKGMQTDADAPLVLNQLPPEKDPEKRPPVGGNAVRGGADGQLLHLYRLAELRSLERLPPVQSLALPIGTEAARGLADPDRASYVPEVLSYPITCLTTLPVSPVELEADGPLNPPLLLTGNICGISGWDNVVYEIARGLHSLGANVRLNSACAHQGDLLPPSLLPTRRARMPEDRELVLAPPHLLERNPHPPGCAIFTMWESDRLQSRFVRIMNKARVVIVPSRWALETFRASGVDVPMEIVPLGHDSLTFHPDLSWPDVCTFGTAGSLICGGMRKNIDRLVKTFIEAFPNEPDVRFRIKVTPECDLPEPVDPRIEVLRRYLPPRELAAWYRSLSVFVNGSSAEGFGLHLVEAMACGRAVIGPAYSAVTEYFDDSVGFPISFREIAADGPLYSGQWAEFDENDLGGVMRRVHADVEEARQRGQRASARVRRFTWKEAGRRLLPILEQYLGEHFTVACEGAHR